MLEVSDVEGSFSTAGLAGPTTIPSYEPTTPIAGLAGPTTPTCGPTTPTTGLAGPTTPTCGPTTPTGGPYRGKNKFE